MFSRSALNDFLIACLARGNSFSLKCLSAQTSASHVTTLFSIPNQRLSSSSLIPRVFLFSLSKMPHFQSDSSYCSITCFY